MMDEISHGEITEIEDVSVPKIAHGESTEVEDVSVSKLAQGEITEVEDVFFSSASEGEITEVEDVLVPSASEGEITESEDVSVPDTSEDVDLRSFDLIRTINNMNKLLQALYHRKSARSSDDGHCTPARCACRINRAVEEEWKLSIMRAKYSEVMRLLKRYPCLLAVHDRRGNTVLHAAASGGNLKLLVYTCSLFLDDHGNAVKEYVHGDKKINRKAFFEQKNDHQVTAKDYLCFSIGGTTMYYYFKNFMKFGQFDRQSNWNATLAAMQDEVFNPFYDNRAVKKRLVDYRDGVYEDKCGVDAKRRLKETIRKEHNDRKEQLDRIFLPRLSEFGISDSDFVAECEELRFLLQRFFTILEYTRVKDVEKNKEYLRAVIKGCVKEGPDVVRYLFCHRNPRGKTTFHFALMAYLIMLIEEIPTGEEYKDCFNARDVRGWTALHQFVARGRLRSVKYLIMDMRVDVNAQLVENYKGFSVRNGVALHLAIMHNRVGVVHMLLKRKDINVNALITRCVRSIGCDIEETNSNLEQWTPLQLAVLLGRHEIIKALLNHPKVEDPGLQRLLKSLWPLGVQLCQNANIEKSNSNEKPPSMLSAIHLAGTMSDPKTLRYFLNISKFDPSVTIQGCTALHFVVDGSPLIMTKYDKLLLKKSNFYDTSHYLSEAPHKIQNGPSDKDRELCIAILIQAGLDVWQKNDNNKFPEPGPHTSLGVRHFWQQKLLSETQDAKNNLNFTGNAISVVSALVATASYVGPLQPPLGLDSDSVQDESLPIRIYMVTNTLSFYMAVASIIFAVVPSLPMPQEGLYEEWQRCQKTIVVAIHLLLLSVVNILISFGAASNAVMSHEYSWQHKGLVFYPALLGGILCMIAICLFYLRLFRLTFVRNLTIKHIYHSVFRVTQKENLKMMDGGKYSYWWHRKRGLNLLDNLILELSK